jgi:hypothetical protein
MLSLKPALLCSALLASVLAHADTSLPYPGAGSNDHVIYCSLEIFNGSTRVERTATVHVTRKKPAKISFARSIQGEVAIVSTRRGGAPELQIKISKLNVSALSWGAVQDQQVRVQLNQNGYEHVLTCEGIDDSLPFTPSPL